MSMRLESERECRMSRRSFLETGAGVAALMTTGAARLSEDGDARRDQAAPLPRRAFGKTGLQLPVLAFGGSAMVEKWAGTYGPQMSREERVAMVRHAFDSGIRYVDTSPNYGESEAIIGEALQDVRREVYLATKVGVPPSDDAILTRDQVRWSVDGSLQRLRTDSVDCLQVHGPAFEYNGQQRAEELLEELVRLREEKVCRWIGLTGHNKYEIMHRLIDSDQFDQLLIGYGYFPKGMDTILSHANLQWRERCLSRAHELGMGVVAMKVMGSFVLGNAASALVPSFPAEQLARLREAAIRWVLSDERVTLAVIGVTRPEQIDQNRETVTRSWALDPEDRRLLAEFSAQALESAVIKRLKIE